MRFKTIYDLQRPSWHRLWWPSWATQRNTKMSSEKRGGAAPPSRRTSQRLVRGEGKIWWPENIIVIIPQGETGDRSPGLRTWSQTQGRSPATRRPGGGQRRPLWRGSCPPSRAQRQRGQPRVRREPRPRRTSCQRWGQTIHECGMIMFVNSGWECSDKANGFSTKRFVAPCLICKNKSWHLQHN